MTNNDNKMIVKKLFSPERIKIYVYTLTHVVVVFLSFLISVLLTKWVSPEVYGQYKYALNILLTVPTFYGFGIHFCVSRVVAEDNSDEKHPIVSVSIAAISVLSLAVSALMFLAAIVAKDFFLYDNLYKTAVVFPFLMVFACKNIVSQLYQGTGKIYRLSLFSLFVNVIIVASICVGKLLFEKLTFEYCIGTYIVTNIIIQLPVLSRIKIFGIKIKSSFLQLLDEVKSFGFKIYLSSFASSGASSLISLICGAVYGYTEYAYYALALSLAQFFTFISSSVAVVKFKSNVHDKFIHKKDIIFMVVLNIMIYIAFSLLIGTVFLWVYSEEYLRSIFYLRLLAISYIFNGMTMYYNRFFIARKKGNAVLSASICVSLLNVVASAVLIPIFQITGLVVVSLITAVFNFFQYVIMYEKYRRDICRSMQEK